MPTETDDQCAQCHRARKRDERMLEAVIGEEAEPERRQNRDHQRQQRAVESAYERRTRAEPID